MQGRQGPTPGPGGANMRRLHFISGLPRSGSTLLAAILRQNPGAHASMSSPVAHLFAAMRGALSARSEFHPLIDDEARRRLLTGVFESFYADKPDDLLLFDTNRLWTSQAPALALLYPDAKLICCVRSLAWVYDSLERTARKAPLEPSKLFNCDPGGSVYSRVEVVGGHRGLVGASYEGLKQLFFSPEAERLMIVRYESLCRDPAAALKAIYDFIGEPGFTHDFENVAFEAEECDARLGARGLHTVKGRVELPQRRTVLPLDLFMRFSKPDFWEDPERNTWDAAIV